MWVLPYPCYRLEIGISIPRIGASHKIFIAIGTPSHAGAPDRTTPPKEGFITSIRNLGSFAECLIIVAAPVGNGSKA